jgi:hypothetical protein
MIRALTAWWRRKDAGQPHRQNSAGGDIRGVEKLLRAWDPLRLPPGQSASTIDYEACAMDIASMLAAGKGISDIAKQLERIRTGSLRLPPDRDHELAFAVKLVIEWKVSLDRDERDVFTEVTKEEFKKAYFRLRGGADSGWTDDYWRERFELKEWPGWRYKVAEPRTRDHDRMTIVTDGAVNEHRLFCMTEESEERLYDHPGKE